MATHLNADRSANAGDSPRYGRTFLTTIQKAADRHLLEKNEIRDALGLLKLYHRASSAPATTAPAPGVNFTNILLAAFTLVDPESIKNKALHSELLTELSSRFLSRNEFFAISEVRV